LDSNQIRRTTEIVHLEFLRTGILKVLKASYPDKIPVSVLRATLRESGNDKISTDEIIVELHYLEEKQLTQLFRVPPKYAEIEKLGAKITARGIDFLNGHVQEVGLASPELG